MNRVQKFLNKLYMKYDAIDDEWWKMKWQLTTLLTRGLSFHLNQLKEALVYKDVIYTSHSLTTWAPMSLEYPHYKVREHFDMLLKYRNLYDSFEKYNPSTVFIRAEERRMRKLIEEIKQELIDYTEESLEEGTRVKFG